MTADIVQRFLGTWGHSDGIKVSEAPYRISPLGAHTDHQDGLVMGMTTHAALRIAFRRRTDARIRLSSREFGHTPEFSVNEALERGHDFGDYARGVTLELGRRMPLSTGCDAWIEGDLPPGGVSSSAAFAVAWLAVLLDLHGADLPNRERVRLVVEAEQRFAGVSVGLLDPTVILFGGPSKVVYLDCEDGTPRTYSISKKCPPFDVVLLDSGVPRDLRESPYNARVLECQSVARALGVTGERPTLRPIGYEAFRRARPRLDPVAARRADHVLSENKRVKLGLQCLLQGDLASFGALVNQSGRSMVDFFGAGVPETIFLLDRLQVDADVYGATLSGAGFGGAMLLLVKPGTLPGIAARVLPPFEATFPEAAMKAKLTLVPLGGETRVDIP